MKGLEASLRARLAERSATVCVVGLGAVGLPLVRLLIEAGFAVIAADADEERVRALSEGRSPLAHLGSAWLQTFASHPCLTWTSIRPGESIQVDGSDAIHVGIICVPTPLNESGDPDLRAMRSAARSLALSMQGPGLVLLESTTFPGSTRRIVAPEFVALGWTLPGLRAAGLGASQEGKPKDDPKGAQGGKESARVAWMAFAPERVDPGRGDPAALHSPRLVGGLEALGTELAETLYRSLGYRVHTTSRAEVAEAAKLVENVYRAVNIALVNELKVSLAAQGIDVWEVLDAAQTKSFGFQRFDPGPGAGGSCIPIDPRYLEHFAREGGVPLRLVELAGRIDRSMAPHVVYGLEQALRERFADLSPEADPIAGARILLLGVAYKPGVGMTTESPALRIAALLQARGARVQYQDPHVPEPVPMPAGEPLFSCEEPVDWQRFDACLYLTDHPEFDLAAIAAGARLLIDTRGKAELEGAGSRYLRL